MRQIYWATEDQKQVLQELNDQRTTWGSSKSGSSIFSTYIAAYQRNYMAYYAPIFNAESWESAISSTGEDSEFVQMKVAKSRTQIRQHFSLLTRTRLNFEAIVDISDAQPQVTAKLARQITTHVRESQNLEQKRQRAAEWADVFGMSFVFTLFREDKGSEYLSADDKNPSIMTGEVNVNVLTAKDVFWDWSIDDWTEVSHATARIKRNRWDLIAEIESKQNIDEKSKQQIIAKVLSCDETESNRGEWQTLGYSAINSNKDFIYVYYWFHKPCPSIPKGRMMSFLANDCVMTDGDNLYGGIPIEPVIFEPISDTTLGYPLFSSLLPAQEMLDHIYSAMATNASQNAVGAMYNPIGSGVTVSDLQGMKFINYQPRDATGGGKPDPVIWPQMSGDHMGFQDRLIAAMDEMAMLNQTLRGQAAANVTSGAMAATLSANALEFFASPQQALDRAFENSMNFAFIAYKSISRVENIINISGESSIGFAKEFQSQEIQKLKRVKLKTSNPLLTQISGRLQIADSMIQQGILSDPMKIFQLLEGAPIDTLFKASWTEQISVQQEIDMLFEGGAVFPLQTDNHPLYIAAYKEILSSPQIRMKSQLTASIVTLIMTRVQMEQQLDPYVKAILRGTPLPEASPMQQPPGDGNMASVANQSLQPEQTAPAKPSQPVENTAPIM